MLLGVLEHVEQVALDHREIQPAPVPLMQTPVQKQRALDLQVIGRQLFRLQQQRVPPRRVLRIPCARKQAPNGF